MQQAIKALNDAGYVGEAQTVLALLLERGDLQAPLRQSLLKQVSQTAQAWRILIEEYRQKQQSFYLVYHNSQGIEAVFHCDFGQC